MADTNNTMNMNDGGSIAIIVVIVILLIILITCGCVYGPRMSMHGSSADNSMQSLREQYNKLRALAGSQMNMSSTKVRQNAGFGSGSAEDEYSALRHPVGNLQPSKGMFRSKMSVSSTRTRQNAGFGSGSAEDEYSALRHPVGNLQPSNAMIRARRVQGDGGFGV